EAQVDEILYPGFSRLRVELGPHLSTTSSTRRSLPVTANEYYSGLSPRQEIVCRDVREHRSLFQDPRHLHDVGGGLQRPLRYPPVATVDRDRCLDPAHESVARGGAHRGLERVGDLLGLSGESPLVGAEKRPYQLPDKLGILLDHVGPGDKDLLKELRERRVLAPRVVNQQDGEATRHRRVGQRRRHERDVYLALLEGREPGQPATNRNDISVLLRHQPSLAESVGGEVGSQRA